MARKKELKKENMALTTLRRMAKNKMAILGLILLIIITVLSILAPYISPIFVHATMSVASAILTAASLSFIGLGVQPPDAEWGAMLSAGRNYIRSAPHLVLFPGIVIMVTVLSLNMLGVGLRDALDPRLKN